MHALLSTFVSIFSCTNNIQIGQMIEISQYMIDFHSNVHCVSEKCCQFDYNFG